MWITRHAVKNPVTTIVVYLAVAIFGLYALHVLPIDLYPEIQNPVLTVVTGYPGASSWDVEEKITKPLEKSLAILSGLDEITSKSMEGVSAVFLKFDYGTNLDEASNDLRVALDWAKQDLPDGVDDPITLKFDTAMMPIYFAAIASDTHDLTKEGTWLDEHVLQNLQGLPGVGSVQMFNVHAEEVHVLARQADLEKAGITLAQVGAALAAANVATPAGSLEDPRYDLPVRVPAEYRTVDEIADEIVGLTPAGPIALRDVADVVEAHKDVRNVARLNESPVAVLFVQKQSGANTVAVAGEVKKKIAELERDLSRNLRFLEIFDSSRFIETMVSNLYDSIALGGLLVILVVIVFLRRWRASLIIALTIPGSMIIAFLLLFLKGYSLNAISLMAMALAVGMVVDNSIVSLENITRHLDGGVDPREASNRGTAEVGIAVIASTLTTIGIFLPLIFVKGLVSILFGQLAFVIVVTLVASLVVSLHLTPMLTSKLLKASTAAQQATRRRTWLDRMDDGYAAFVRASLKRRWLVYLVSTLLLVGSAGTMATLGFDFLPQFDSGDIQVMAELPLGSSIQQTAAVGEKLSAGLRRIPEVQRVFYRAGLSEGGWGAAMGQNEGTNVLELSVKLPSIDTKRRGVKLVAEDVRRVLEAEPVLTSFDVNLSDGGPGAMFGSKPVLLQILGHDYARLKVAAWEAEKLMASIEGTRNVAAEIPHEKPEVQIELDRRRMALLGVNAAAASGVLRTAVNGTTVTRCRGQGRDIEVVLRLREDDRRTLEATGRVQVPSVAGAPVALNNFSKVGSGFSPISIDHVDQRRVLTVGANTFDRSLGEIAAEFDRRSEDLRHTYDDLTFRWGGEVKQQRENSALLGLVLLIGVLLTYLVMASQFESFLDPFVIMFSVPFAFTGSFLALAASGDNFNVLAFLGLIMLVGIVVNNAIVLIDYINLMRSEGHPLLDAVVETTRRRLRPILMTTITTIIGTVPLALASGEGYELWRPIGVTVVGGLTLSTAVTLVIIPSLYVTFERFRKRWRPTA